jgi:hypothetical protein
MFALRKRFTILLALVLVFCTTTGCEEEDYEVAAKSIRSLTALTMTEVFAKNPTLIAPVCVMAKLNRDAIINREIDPVQANLALESVIAEIKGLDEDDAHMVKQLFAVILPMLDPPDEPVLKEPYYSFMIAFYNGLLDSCKLEDATSGSVPTSYAI